MQFVVAVFCHTRDVGESEHVSIAGWSHRHYYLGRCLETCNFVGGCSTRRVGRAGQVGIVQYVVSWTECTVLAASMEPDSLVSPSCLWIDTVKVDWHG